MKKHVFTIPFLCLVLFSCSPDEPSQNPDGRKLISRIDIEHPQTATVDTTVQQSRTEYYTFEYHSDGQVAAISHFEEYSTQTGNGIYIHHGKTKTTYTFDISGDRLNFAMSSKDEDLVFGSTTELSMSIPFRLNEQGHVAACVNPINGQEMENYYYDSKGQLISRRSANDRYDNHDTYVWESGNMVSQTDSYNNTIHYAYTNHRNLSNMDMGVFLSGSLSFYTEEMRHLAIWGYFGKINQNIIDIGNNSHGYEYTFNNEGLVTEISQYSYGELTKTVRIAYK